jgi:hypothetical protein
MDERSEFHTWYQRLASWLMHVNCQLSTTTISLLCRCSYSSTSITYRYSSSSYCTTYKVYTRRTPHTHAIQCFIHTVWNIKGGAPSVDMLIWYSRRRRFWEIWTMHAAIHTNIPYRYSTPLVDNANSAVAMKNTCSNMGAKSAKVRKMLCDPCSDIDINFFSLCWRKTLCVPAEIAPNASILRQTPHLPHSNASLASLPQFTGQNLPQADAYRKQKVLRKTDWLLCFVKTSKIVLTVVLITKPMYVTTLYLFYNDMYKSKRNLAFNVSS